MDIAIHPIINEENGLPFVVCGIGSQAHQCHIIRNEGYNLHQIIFSTKGKGFIKINGYENEVGEGGYIYLKPHEPHEYYGLTKEWSTNWILFTGENIQAALNKIGFENSYIGAYLNKPNVNNLFNNIIVTLKGNDSLKGFTASSILYSILIELYRASSHKISKGCTQNDLIIEPVIDYIDKYFREDISLEELAALVKVTPQHLCKVFKGKRSMRPFEYLAKRRIQEAKKLLISSDLNIKDICEAVGYKDSSYFCAIFKKYEMISPTDFRGGSRKPRVKLVKAHENFTSF